MMRLLVLLTGTVLASWSAIAQTPSGTPADTAFYTVSYTEVMPSSKAAAIATFKAYRTSSLKQEGYIRFELFEQVGRPSHFAIVETWRDQKAFDARGTAQKELVDALKPIRTSEYDQRPYKTLTVAPVPSSAGRQAVYVVTHVDVSANPQVPVLLRQQAESSRREPGNLRFDVMQHTMRANHFTVVEAWQDDKARETHAAAAHTRKYRDDLGAFTGSPLDERVYAVVE